MSVVIPSGIREGGMVAGATSPDRWLHGRLR